MHFKKATGGGRGLNLIFFTIVSVLWTISCGPSGPGPRNPAVRTSENKPSAAKKAVARPVTGDFLLKDINGKSHALSDYLGKYVIVASCFSVWCEPCKSELSALEKLYETYKGRNVIVLALSMDPPEFRRELRLLAKKLGLTFPVLIDDELKAADLFNPDRNMPFSTVIDMNRNQIWSHMGYVPGDEKELESVILSALDEKPATSENVH